MSERANRSAYTNWHDAAVVDEAVARTHLTLGQAWVTARTAATGASVFGVGLQYACEAPEGTGNVRGILDSDPNNTVSSTMPHQNSAVALV